MFVPLYDDNSLKKIRFQYVTFFLIATNIAVFAFLQGGIQGLAPKINEIFTASFAIIPTEFLGGVLPANMPGAQHQLAIPEPLTVLTYMFLHGSWWHLGGNMLFLWVFGDNVEDALGHFRFLVFYLLCGVAAGMAQIFLTPVSDSILVGASGAVAGVIAAYLLLYPHVWVWVLVLGRLPLNLKAYWVIVAWFAFQLISALSLEKGVQNIAWWAHVGGFIAGALLILVMRPSGVRLFSKEMRSG